MARSISAPEPGHLDYRSASPTVLRASIPVLQRGDRAREPRSRSRPVRPRRPSRNAPFRVAITHRDQLDEEHQTRDNERATGRASPSPLRRPGPPKRRRFGPPPSRPERTASGHQIGSPRRDGAMIKIASHQLDEDASVRNERVSAPVLHVAGAQTRRALTTPPAAEQAGAHRSWSALNSCRALSQARRGRSRPKPRERGRGNRASLEGPRRVWPPRRGDATARPQWPSGAGSGPQSGSLGQIALRCENLSGDNGTERAAPRTLLSHLAGRR